jgi:hypothetical protein
MKREKLLNYAIPEIEIQIFDNISYEPINTRLNAFDVYLSKKKTFIKSVALLS